MIRSNENTRFINHLESHNNLDRAIELLRSKIIDIMIFNSRITGPLLLPGAVYLPAEAISGSEKMTLHVWSHPNIYGCDYFRLLMDFLRQP